MKRDISFTVLLLLCLLAIQTVFSQSNPRKFYKYDVIETSSSSLEVFAAPSINDYGDVAFSARRNPGGGTVFLNVFDEPNVDLMPGSGGSPNNIVSGRVQINNSQQVIQQTFLSGTKPVQTLLRRINGVNDFTLIAYANGAGSFDDFDEIWPGSISLNNDGDPVFLTRVENNTTILTTGIRPNFSTFQFPSSSDMLRPMISDCGDVVVRGGANQTDPIRLYADDLSFFDTIADSSSGFTVLGQSPGISGCIEVVVFYGNLSVAGAETLGTNPGPGIFASIEIDKKTKQRQIVRLAGRLIEDVSADGGNDDGYCDPGETCVPAELGFTSEGIPISFNSFAADSRVAITHQETGAKGIEDDVFVVSFIGTPNIASDDPARPFSNQQGLWTVTTEIKNIDGVLRERPIGPIPVIQVGDFVEGRTVNTINVYDPIAAVRIPDIPEESLGDHRLAFHLGTNNGNMIIRAERNVATPVIFIPGIMGSRLAEISGSSQTERWPGLNLGLLTGANFDRLLPSQNANIVATDAIRDIVNVDGVTIVGEFYKSILETFSMSGGLREYQVQGNPERRTFEGCDLAQAKTRPNLFVFAYDWRKSNIANAASLQQYVRCIKRFYPGTKVDIVAHSMGGLLARRYILNNPSDHSVRKMITVGSPFLGAPRSLETMETGRLRFLPDFLDKRIPTFVTNRVKNLAFETPAIHELFPSEGYFTLGGRPFIEETYDINEDGITPQIYDYPMTAGFFDARFSSLPYDKNFALHGSPGQDNWKNDTSGVEYFHIFGERRRRDTVNQIIATPVARRPLSVTRWDLNIKVNRGFGDKTVPRLSAERIGSGNFNFPDATLKPYVAENRAENSRYEHTGLVKAPEVIDQVLTYLELPFQFSFSNLRKNNGGGDVPSYEYKANSGLDISQLRPPPGEGYYVTIVGVERLEIADDLGNTNSPLGDMGFELAVPDVNYSGGLFNDEIHVGSHGLDMPADEGAYTIKFRTGTDSVDVEVLRGLTILPRISRSAISIWSYPRM